MNGSALLSPLDWLPVAVAVLVCGAAVRCGRTRTGPQRRAWLLLAPAALVWAVATAVAVFGGISSSDVRDAPPGLLALTALGVVAWPVVGVAAVAMLTAPHQTRATAVPDVLDCLVLALAGLVVVWAFVLGPVHAAAPAGSVSWVVVLTALVGVDVPLAALHALVRSPERDGHLRLALVGLSVVSFGDLASARSYALHGDAADAAALLLWTLGWAAVLVGAAVGVHRAQAGTTGAGLRGGSRLTHVTAGITVLATACGVAIGGGRADPVLLWLSTALLLGVVCRTLVEVHRTHRLRRDLETRVAERTRALAHRERRSTALVEHSADLVVVLDSEGCVTYANPGAARVLGVPHGSSTGRAAVVHLHAGDGSAGTAALDAAIAAGVAQVEVRLALRHADGHRVDVDAVVTDLLDDPDVRGLVVNARDVTTALELERQLTQQAFSDALTGLPNRALFKDRLEHALRSRGTRAPVKVCYLDLDGFKAVNDTLGHSAGDELLVLVAQRLLTAVRQGDTVARLGGDEFALLLDEGVELDEAERLAGRVCEAVRQPFTVRGTEVLVGTSVGLASTRTAGRDAEHLMRAADLAMYEAKATRKGGWAVYAPHMHAALVERVQLEGDLRRAVEEGQFRVVYQPLVGMGDGGVTGVEALVRWDHPERGVIGPATFIPLAESTGLIDAIGAFVLREACQQVTTWRAEVPGAEQMRVSVNLSGHQVADPGLVGQVEAVLGQTGLPATSLVLEVTESTIVGQDETALATLNALRALGVRLAIDDFGTGYSSLSYLHRLPVDILKIDKSFVDRLTADGDPTLVDAILSMAATLGMTTVAEGVEHEHQRAALTGQGCTTGQGYYFSPPVEAHLLPGLVVDALLAAPGDPVRGAAPRAPLGSPGA